MTEFITRTRREFLMAAAAAMASAAGAASSAVAADDRKLDGANDRSPNRDPMAIHRSTIVMNGLDPSPASSEYLGLMQQGGIGAWLRAAQQGLADFAAAHEFCDSNRGRIAIVRTVREIREARRQGKLAQVLGWQSAEQLSGDRGPAALAGPAIANLRAYYEMGLRTCGIAYNLANEFGAGCLEPEKGLTRNGRKLVEEIHKLRIVLDIGGHTGERTSLDALAISSGVPVICSHTNIRTLNDNPRCTSDRLIDAIAGTGGVIGITAASDFHLRSRNDIAVARSPQASLEQHLDQYDYIRKRVGVDHVGLGPDFIFGMPVPNQAALDAAKESQTNSNGSAQYSTREVVSLQLPWSFVKGFERIDELPNVTRGLIRRGWSTAEIRKVLGENWLRVYAQVWGA